ncbi:MAG: LysR family transcriptional regulator [Hyphomicrobiaceae bacterium]
MDINLARTFLSVAETGSFIEAARKMNITQSTVSARIKGLEEMLGRPLFERSKSGAALTAAGTQFQKHALAIVRVWQHAQLELRLTEEHRDHLAVGSELPLWDGFLMKWVGWLRANVSDIAVSGTSAAPGALLERLVEGTLDLAVLYRPSQPPGLRMEHLFDEEFVLVAGNTAAGRRGPVDLVLVDWGPNVQLDATVTPPEPARRGLRLNLGSLGLDYVLANNGLGYFPLRLVRTHLARGRLKLVKRGRRFTVPVYMLYPEAHDEEAYEPILMSLREHAARQVTGAEASAAR